MDSSLSPERAEQIRTLFGAVLDLAPDERAAFLDQACADDADLHREVEALLEAYDQADEVLHKLDHPVSDPPDRLIGQRVSHYQIVEKLGSGGMGVVYKACDTKLDRTVALKFLPPHLSLDAEAKARFIHEAKAASALDHVNLGYIHEIDETEEGHLFIAMAFYAGGTLKQKIAGGPLPVEQAVEMAMQVARGLSKAHAAGIVHRDIKPANVMVTTDGVAKVVDFGLAKRGDVSLTQTGTTLGTVAYMSPEQARGEKVDHRTDLWSLGVVLYEMVTGERPFRGDYAAALYAIRHDAPKPVRALRPEVPEALAQIVEKLLTKDPEERYGQAEEVLADLGVPQRVLEAAQPEARSVSAASARLPRVLRYGSVALMVLVLALVGYFLFAGGRAPIDSIAVLPLKNLTGNAELEYVADGMTEALIGKLGRIKALRRVISRTSVMRFKETDKSLPEIGRALDVAAVVEGSVRSFGERVQIDVRLIDAGTEERLWEQSFTRSLGDVLTLQNEVALAIAQAVEVQMTPTEEAHLAEVAEVDPEVYDLYLKGLQARVRDVGSLQQRIAYFEQAIALDSSFAPAYAALAIEYALEGGLDLQPGGEIKAWQLAEKALALNPSLSEPYVALGLVRELVDWNWAGAEEAFKRALERNPGDAFAHHELGMLWMRLGRFEEAVAQAKQALYLDPLSARYQSGVGEIYFYSPATGYIRGGTNPSKCLHKKEDGWRNGNPIHVWDCAAGGAENKTWTYDPATGYIRGGTNPTKCLHKEDGWRNGNPIHVWDCAAGGAENKTWTYDGRYDEAIAELMKAYALNPNAGHTHGLLGRAYWHKGMYEEALRWWEVAGFSEVGRARYDAVTGQPEKMLGMLEDAKALWAQGDAERLLWSIATAYAALGEKDQALDWLEKAYDERLGLLIYIKVDPYFYPLHGEPRFQALLKKMRLD